MASPTHWYQNLGKDKNAKIENSAMHMLPRLYLPRPMPCFTDQLDFPLVVDLDAIAELQRGCCLPAQTGFPQIH